MFLTLGIFLMVEEWFQSLRQITFIQLLWREQKCNRRDVYAIHPAIWSMSVTSISSWVEFRLAVHHLHSSKGELYPLDRSTGMFPLLLRKNKNNSSIGSKKYWSEITMWTMHTCMHDCTFSAFYHCQENFYCATLFMPNQRQLNLSFKNLIIY